jgi:amino acid permease
MRSYAGGRGAKRHASLESIGEEVDPDKLSDEHTFVNLVKSALGAGSISLPMAYKQGGMWASAVLTIVLGAVSAYTAVLLVLCEQELANRHTVKVARKQPAIVIKRTTEQAPTADTDDLSAGLLSKEEGGDVKLPSYIVQKPAYSFAQVAAYAFPSCVMTCGKAKWNLAELFVNSFVFFGTLGVSSAFYIFIINTICQVFTELSDPVCQLVIIPLVLMLAYLRSFRLLSFTSIYGDVSVSLALLSVIIFGLIEEGGFTFKMSVQGNPGIHLSAIPTLLGPIGFCFAVHICLLPVAQSMQHPENWGKVCYKAYTVLTLINAVFAMMVFAIFADDIKDPCTDNVKGAGGEAGKVVLSGVKLLFASALLFTIPMVLAAGREIVETYAVKQYESMGCTKRKKGGNKGNEYKSMQHNGASPAMNTRRLPSDDPRISNPESEDDSDKEEEAGMFSGVEMVRNIVRTILVLALPLIKSAVPDVSRCTCMSVHAWPITL